MSDRRKTNHKRKYLMPQDARKEWFKPNKKQLASRDLLRGEHQSWFELNA